MSFKDNFEEKPNTEEKIKNRESWFKLILLSILSIIIFWKLALTSWSFNFSNFNFSDLLFLILAIFSIWLSIIFYFKASETSNNFYNNSYKFTSNLGEILGRIEAGFGEKLKHIDENYTNFFNNNISNSSGSKSKREVMEKTKIKKIEKNKNKIIEDLLKQTKLEKKEKEKILENFKAKEKELDFAKKRLLEYKTRSSFNRSPMISYIKHRVIDLLGGNQLINLDKNKIKERFFSIENRLNREFINDMQINGFVDKEGFLTDEGIKIIKDLSKRSIEMVS